jgi:hypothetical protein
MISHSIPYRGIYVFKGNNIMARTLNDLLALRTKGNRLKIKNMAEDMLRKQYNLCGIIFGFLIGYYYNQLFSLD